MSFFGSSPSTPTAEASSTELKNALMKQVQAEAAMTNARALVGVRSLSPCPLYPKSNFKKKKKIENQRKLLRPLHHIARLQPLLRRKQLSVVVHGKIHFRLERDQSSLYQPCAA